MAKTQLNVRIDEDAAAAARQAADARHLTVQEYIEQLVRADTDPLRVKFLASARSFIDEFGPLIEERASAPRG
jgi:hypothetical protein